MRHVVYDNPEAMLAWAAKRVPGGQSREDAQAIGLARDGVLIAVTVFDTFGPTQCNLAIAAEPGRRWLTRGYIQHVLAHPFINCGFDRITCFVSEHNVDSLRFTRHFGWTLEGRQREAGLEGEDMLMFGLLRRECRWLPKSLGRM